MLVGNKVTKRLQCNYDAQDATIERIEKSGGTIIQCNCVQIGKVGEIVYAVPLKADLEAATRIRGIIEYSGPLEEHEELLLSALNALIDGTDNAQEAFQPYQTRLNKDLDKWVYNSMMEKQFQDEDWYDEREMLEKRINSYVYYQSWIDTIVGNDHVGVSQWEGPKRGKVQK